MTSSLAQVCASASPHTQVEHRPISLYWETLTKTSIFPLISLSFSKTSEPKKRQQMRHVHKSQKQIKVAKSTRGYINSRAVTAGA